ncbi:unnamed protein product [Closterium sp. NIES-64]|nr:unnamed protein product [Closterium sp. NIES-64]
MLTVAFAIVALSTVTESASYGDTGRATATFYGSGDGGNCGYGVLAESGYGPLIAAGSAPLYKGGKGCGACYKVRCVDSQWCKDAEITVPITDFCPGGGVCCATCTHFDLSQPAFGIIADPVAGVIPLAYQRVPCSFPTSITFRVTGTNYWMNVLLLRVGGPGEVALVEVSSKNDPNWRPLTHDWGTNWTTGGVTIPNASYSIDSNGGAATSSNAQVGAGGTAAAGAVGAGNPVTAGRVKRGKKWRTEAAPPKKPGGGHPAGKGHRAPGKGHHVKTQPVLAR